MKRCLVLLSLLTLFLLSGCNQKPSALSLDNASAFICEKPIERDAIPPEDLSLFEKFCPVFVIEDNRKGYNRVGKPKIKRGPQKKLEAYVDPSSHPIYVQRVNFVTAKGKYTNLIYRVHFQKVPFGLIPFQLTVGKNAGLLIIVTLNCHQKPVLITSVNTCGCFVVITPTNYLGCDCFPPNWKSKPTYRQESQKGCGRVLDKSKCISMVYYPDPIDESYHPVFFLQSKTHRVTDLFVEKKSKIQAQYNVASMPLTPMQTLDHLPIEGEKETLSFYYTELSKGFVRDSLKPFELLFMSWWAFDPNVGVDKKYAPANQLTRRFYTSLNPAYWKESDLWNFPVAARFYGWEL